MVESASPYPTLSLQLPEGELIPIGGKATYDNLKIVASRMADRSGLTIVSLTACADEYEGKFVKNKAMFADAFTELGIAGEIFHLHAGTNFRDGRSMLESSSTVFITGGSQERGVSAFRKTGLNEVLQDVHKKGVTVAGTSAGASMLPRYMPNRDDIVEGLGLVDGVFVDQHFDERPWRRQRAEDAAKKGFFVFALKEGSGVVYKAAEATVFGKGMDFFYMTTEGVVRQEVSAGYINLSTRASLATRRDAPLAA